MEIVYFVGCQKSLTGFQKALADSTDSILKPHPHKRVLLTHTIWCSASTFLCNRLSIFIARGRECACPFVRPHLGKRHSALLTSRQGVHRLQCQFSRNTEGSKVGPMHLLLDLRVHLLHVLHRRQGQVQAINVMLAENSKAHLRQYTMDHQISVIVLQNHTHVFEICLFYSVFSISPSEFNVQIKTNNDSERRGVVCNTRPSPMRG